MRLAILPALALCLVLTGTTHAQSVFGTTSTTTSNRTAQRGSGLTSIFSGGLKLSSLMPSFSANVYGRNAPTRSAIPDSSDPNYLSHFGFRKGR